MSETNKLLLEKYKYLFLELEEMNDESRPYPQKTIFLVLKPLIEELIESSVRGPYKEVLRRLEVFLKKFNINYAPLSYNNFYRFLKKNNLIKKEIKEKPVNKTVSGTKKNDIKNSALLKRDPISELKNI